MSDPFDFDPPKSRAYYHRPRSAGRNWVAPAVVISVAMAVVGVVAIAFIVWRSGSPPSPAVEGHVWTAAQLLNYLQRHHVNPGERVTVTDDDRASAGLLLVYRFSDATSARVAVANHKPVAFAWGRFVIVAPPDIERRAHAALHP